MDSFQEELVKLKGEQIRFQDVTCLVTGDFLTGKVREVGSDCVGISVLHPEQQKGNRLYNLTNIVWLESY